jgi:SIR2-like protein
MQFAKNGPNVPERLLEAHEDGRVMFFCGAGISYAAGLPGFKGLIDGIYVELGDVPSPIEAAAIKNGQFDTALGLLEARVAGGRTIVRQALVRVLTPDLTAPNALTTHDALLTLAKTRADRYRLITTNFDRLFEEVIVKRRLVIPTYKAPLLPTPKSRLNGLIYLHGSISSSPAPAELDQLVVSSGDFGLSYLTDRWAARFVSELFRTYTVCFVGYSINDPVLRYMMDALAADRLLGESPPEMFAFGSYSGGKLAKSSDEWLAKNVTPIMYKESGGHAALRKTLATWAGTYRDGVLGKEKIVLANALAKPVASTAEDDFVGRMIWALSDKQSLPAKRFAEHDPVPPLDWLEPLLEDRFAHLDLVRFQVTPDRDLDKRLVFSLLHRPTPYKRASWMSLVQLDRWGAGQWDEVMFQLARWLARHLDDPKLLLWVTSRGGPLHPQFGAVVKERLAKKPPSAVMAMLWRLVLSGRIAYRTFDMSIYEFAERLATEKPTSSMKLEFRGYLMPRVKLRQPMKMWDEEKSTESLDQDSSSPAERRVSQVVDWDVVATVDHLHSALEDLRRSPNWKPLLRGFLIDATALLRDAMDLRRELGGADDLNDLSYVHQPSIAEHSQNRDFHDWTALIDVAREAWLVAAEEKPLEALAEAEQWMRATYPVFKRLAFFAATDPRVVPVETALAWLVSDAGWWIWSVETGREVFQLIRNLGPRLTPEQRVLLENLVAEGPPRRMYREELTSPEFQRIWDREVWLRLKKLAFAGPPLGKSAGDQLAALSTKYPGWALAADESDEFAFWMGSGAEESAGVTVTPQRRRDLVQWLRANPTSEYGRDDDWRDRCKRDFASTASALLELAKSNEWPVDRWRAAIQAWADEKLSLLAWRHMSGVIENAPDHVIATLAHSISWWLQATSARITTTSDRLFRLFGRILDVSAAQEVGDEADLVSRAINHPVGQVTEAATKWWYKQSLQDGQGLQEPVRALFTRICSSREPILRYGRLILAHHLIALYRVDPKWTVANLFPFFSWRHSSADATAAWQGFLWTPRLYAPLLDAIKEDLLQTAGHYEALGQFGRQYADMLTFAALEGVQTITPQQFAEATRALPPKGLAEAANTVARALEGSGEQRPQYWSNRVFPYIRQVWPKSASPSRAISSAFARICVATGDAFPQAVNLLSPWLQPGEDDLTVRRLAETNLGTEFPEVSLDFLGKIVDESDMFPPRELATLLAAIAASSPDLMTHQTFRRLEVLVRRSGR